MTQAASHANLLRCMYSEEELLISGENLALLQELEVLETIDDALQARLTAQQSLDFQLLVKLDEEHTFVLLVKFSLLAGAQDEPPRVILARPTFLQRQAYDRLAAGLPSTGDDLDVITEAYAYLVEHGPSYITPEAQPKIDSIEQSTEPLSRTWFYLPSLSTREKRLDLCRMAPHYSLTGFVLAGKPGVLCLEGEARQVQAYMADVKRNSWADIPSFQKKVSERLREEAIERRQFTDMREITELIALHGQRGNRGDLGQVEAFLKEQGLGHVFAFVFMQQL